MELQIKCIGKKENMEGDNYYAELTFQQVVDGVAVTEVSTYSPGAAIGTPNSPLRKVQSEQNLNSSSKLEYTLSGLFTVKINDPEKSSNYILGKVYSISISEPDSPKAAKSPKTK